MDYARVPRGLMLSPQPMKMVDFTPSQPLPPPPTFPLRIQKRIQMSPPPLAPLPPQQYFVPAMPPYRPPPTVPERQTYFLLSEPPVRDSMVEPQPEPAYAQHPVASMYTTPYLERDVLCTPGIYLTGDSGEFYVVPPNAPQCQNYRIA